MTTRAAALRAVVDGMREHVAHWRKENIGYPVSVADKAVLEWAAQIEAALALGDEGGYMKHFVAFWSGVVSKHDDYESAAAVAMPHEDGAVYVRVDSPLRFTPAEREALTVARLACINTASRNLLGGGTGDHYDNAAAVLRTMLAERSADAEAKFGDKP